MTFHDLEISFDSTASEPVYRQIGDVIRKFITSNAIAPDTRLPDLTTFADQCGVSLRTMEKALQVLINDGWCYRRPKKGTFVGNGAAVVQRSDNSHAPAICGIVNYGSSFDFVNDTMIASVYNGMQEQAVAANLDLLIIPPAKIDFYYHNRTVNLSGILIWQWLDRDEIMMLAARYPDLRFIFVNYDPGQLEDSPDNVHAILNDDFAGGFEAGLALTERGHRDFAIFTTQLADVNYTLRENGFVQALQNAGVEWENRFIYTCNDNNAPSVEQNIEIGRKLAAQALHDRPHITAIFCVNDLIAAGAADYLDAHNLRQQVELIGYDYVLFPNLSRDRRFTTVKIAFRTMGTQAVSFIAGNRKYHPKVLRIAPAMLPCWNIEPLTIKPRNIL